MRKWWIAAAVVVVLAVGVVAVVTRGFGAGGGSATGTAAPTSVPVSASDVGAAPGPTDGEVVNALNAGAAGDGTTDDTAVLQRLLDGLHSGDQLQLPAGRTFVHGDVLTVHIDGVTIAGGGTLLATDEENSALQVAADSVTLQGITVATADTRKRWSAPQQTGVWLDGHRDVILTDVTVQGSASAGVFVQGTEHFTLTHVEVSDTRADGIHMTAGARYGLVSDVLTQNTSDDGVAVVAYTDDRSQARDIVIQQPHVHGNTHGRGVSVVGGADVQISDVDIRDTAAAAIYVACERGSFDTRVPTQVTVAGGTVDAANQDDSVDHGAVLVYNASDSGNDVLQDVTVRDLTINDTRELASRQVALVSDHDAPIRGVTLTDLSFTGSGPGTLLETTSDDLGYRASGLTENGRPVDE
jgi:hypothetical protein